MRWNAVVGEIGWQRWQRGVQVGEWMSGPLSVGVLVSSSVTQEVDPRLSSVCIEVRRHGAV